MLHLWKTAALKKNLQSDVWLSSHHAYAYVSELGCIWVSACIRLCACLLPCIFLHHSFIEIKKNSQLIILAFYCLLGLYADMARWASTGFGQSPPKRAVRNHESQSHLARKTSKKKFRREFVFEYCTGTFFLRGFFFVFVDTRDHNPFYSWCYTQLLYIEPENSCWSGLKAR